MSRNQRRNRRNKSSGSQAANRNTHPGDVEGRSAETAFWRSSTETKSSLKTTELIAYAAAVLAVIMTALAVDANGADGDDPFGAETAIRYITYLTIGYLVARGLAKSGSHERTGRHTDVDDVASHAVVVDDDDVAPRAVGDDDVAGGEHDERDGRDGETEDTESAPERSDDVEHAAAGTADARR